MNEQCGEEPGRSSPSYCLCNLAPVARWARPQGFLRARFPTVLLFKQGYLPQRLADENPWGLIAMIIPHLLSMGNTGSKGGYIPEPSVNAAPSVIASDRRERSNLPTWPNEIASSLRSSQ